MNKVLFLFIGESFRTGCQGSRVIGNPKSINGQINASSSHIRFIEHIKQKFNINSIKVYLNTYKTKYFNEILKIYEPYLLEYTSHDNVIGLNNLFHDSINKINKKQNIEEYDFIFYIRIDLFLKYYFYDLFIPDSDKILFPSICWINCHMTHDRHPRPSDMMIYIPKKMFKNIKYIDVGHMIWQILINNGLTYNDMDTMISTYHDSDSNKDFNPMYKIVNRPECMIFHSEGYIFDKYNSMYNVILP
jgi:hypothetical protein